LTATPLTLARAQNRTEWLLLESDLARPPLYSGEDRAALLAALANWHPNLGPHDPGPALRSARVAVGNDGLLFFVTDRTPPGGPLPLEAHALAYGHPLDNVGVAAATAQIRDGQPSGASSCAIMPTLRSIVHGGSRPTAAAPPRNPSISYPAKLSRFRARIRPAPITSSSRSIPTPSRSTTAFR